MKKIFLVTLLFASSVNSEPFRSQKPVWCDEYKTVLESLANRYNEKPIWAGKDLQNGNMYVMTTNEKEGTWTYIETDGKVACVLGAGTDSSMMLGEKI
jgi:hypothetical protein